MRHYGPGHDEEMMEYGDYDPPKPTPKPTKKKPKKAKRRLLSV